MRTSFLIHIGLLSVLLFSACTRQENEPLFNGGIFALEISDGGFLSVEQAATRANESGYQTIFTAGDKVGLIVINQSGIVTTDNKPFTYNGTKWMADAEDMEKHVEGAQYIVYYPYSTAMNGKSTEAEIITASAAHQDQRNYANYTASDLMIGSGGSFNQAGNVLAVALKHVHTLLVLAPQYTYSVDGETYDWTMEDILDHFTSSGFTIGDKVYLPWKDKEGMMRVVIPTSELPQSLSIRYYYTYKGTKKAGTAIVSAGQTGCYQRIILVLPYTLGIDAVYYADGTTLPSEAGYSKSSPVGIVFWLGDITNDDPLLKKKFPQGTKGLAVALHDAGDNSYWSSSYEDITNNWLKDQSTTYGITSLKESDKMQGYANTQALMDYNTKSSNVQTNSNLKVLPIEAITTTYVAAHPAPASSSGWYFPSVKELKYMCWGQGATSQSTAGRDILNAQLGKVSGTSLQSLDYWSSTERGNYWAWNVGFDNGLVYNNGYKNNYSYGVRAVLAF